MESARKTKGSKPKQKNGLRLKRAFSLAEIRDKCDEICFHDKSEQFQRFTCQLNYYTGFHGVGYLFCLSQVLLDVLVIYMTNMTTLKLTSLKLELDKMFSSSFSFFQTSNPSTMAASSRPVFVLLPGASQTLACLWPFVTHPSSEGLRRLLVLSWPVY